MSNTDKDLTQWIEVQRQASGRISRGESPELHLHQHQHPAPELRRELPHPLVTAMTMLIVSVAIALPLTLIAVILETAKPTVQYVQPQRGGW